YEALRAFVRDRLLMPTTMRRAWRVVVPSEATNVDVKKYYHVPEQKLALIPNGFQSLEAVVGEPVDPTLMPYFFFAGRVKYRKNVHGIVKGFIEFKRRTKAPIKLLLAGGYGGEYYASLRAELEAAGLWDDVRFLGYVSTAQLKGLYSGALACVFVSLNEGFG